MKDLHSPSMDRLFKSILKLENVDECYQFFEDLCTIKELQDMAQRLVAAEMLEKGENYLSIASGIGISTATISRVSKALNYGSGGYELILGRLRETAESPEE